MLELLAPAGSMEALRAAVQNGANAVYLGSGSFNARQSAKNFTPQMLDEAIKYCHIRGVAVHLTVNTLVSDRETTALCDLIRRAAESGVDAFIVQDLGVVQLCHQIAPQIPIHGSTQMTIHSLPGVLLCAAWGMQRVVLSRELSREEIRYICANSPIEIEVFAHGALCMCYSGQCYLSAAIGGRSGNRGRCAQPCRQSYGHGRWANKYPLSLKDNCLIPYLRDLEQMGVTSLKLEGRMKRPEYVATVTGIYRKALDEGNVTRAMMEDLTAAFSRQGFTDGYYTGRIGQQMFGIREDKKENQNWLREARLTYEVTEKSLVPVVFHMVVTNSGSSLTVSDQDHHSCRVEGPQPEAARSVELTEEVLSARLCKTGGTIFRCIEVRCDIDPGLTLSAAVINALRRDALSQLLALRGRRMAVSVHKPRKIVKYPGLRAAPGWTIQVTSLDQITGRVLKYKPQVLYIPLHLLCENPILCRDLVKQVHIAAVLPRIVHDGEMGKLRQNLAAVRDLGVQEALVGNLGLMLPVRDAGMDIRGDYGLNLYNSGAVNVTRSMEFLSATLSFEMTFPQIRDVSKAVPCEILSYGRMPLMVTENCLFQSKTGACSCHLSTTKLIDKTGAEFPVIRDGDSCRSILLNGKKLNLLDRQEDLSHLGLWATRLYFTTENPKEVDRVLASCLNPQPFDPGASTRGLYLRGVE